MRILFIILFFLGFIQSPSVAQNLVSNPSFEGKTDCPEKNGDIKKCVSWSTTSAGSTPDYFHRCYVSGSIAGVELGVPKNSEGYKEAHTGDGYMGLSLFFKKNYTTREYIQNKLQEPLERGAKYKLSFYICLSDSSEFTSNHISVDFSVMPNGLLANAPENLLMGRNLVTIRNHEAMLSKTWTKVETTFIAQGGEAYMIIGSFSGSMSEKEYKKRLRKSVLDCKDNECAAYYYIDDVVLEEIVVQKLNPKFD